MGYGWTCDLCGSCVSDGSVNEILVHSVKEEAFMQEPNEDTDSPSRALNYLLPDLVASCPNTPRSCSRAENCSRSSALSHGSVKLTGRRLRYLSDQFAVKHRKAKAQDDTTQDWFTGFLSVCASIVLELWKFPT